MPLPDNRDLEDLLTETTHQAERESTLITLAPQLAEEVIRLREEIDRIKQHCLDGEPRQSLKYRP